MPNVAKVLREEISRIGRKEAKAAFTPLQKRTIRLERAAADLKRRIALLEKLNKQLQGQLKVMLAAQPAPSAETSSSHEWISGKGIKRLRKRLGLTQADFAKLVGVSDQAIVNWEKIPGMLKLRDTSKAAIFAIRGIGAREAKKRLEAMKATTASKAVPKRRKRGKRK